MYRTIKTTMAAAAVGVVLLAGCGGDAAADLKKDLQDSGMSAETSDCIVKGLQSRGVDLSQYGSPSAEDEGKITDAVSECMVGDLDLDVPTSTTP